MLSYFREKITDMVHNTMAQCRRDVLWNRMLTGHMTEEDSRKKKKNDTDDKLEGVGQLNIVEKSSFACFICFTIMANQYKNSD